MSKKVGVLLLLALTGLTPVFGQVFGQVDHAEADVVIQVDEERGFTAQVEITSNVFRFTDVQFSDSEERNLRTNFRMMENLPGGALNVLDGSSVRFGFNADWFGGSLSVNRGGVDGVRAWVSFLDGFVRFSGGSDLDFGMADAMGAGAGLRVYDDHVRDVGFGQAEHPTIDSNRNPDNITGGRGLLLEFDIERLLPAVPVRVALAAGGSLEDLTDSTRRVLMLRQTGVSDFGQVPVYGHTMHYGINVGSRIGDLARINAAYIFQSEKNENWFRFDSVTNSVTPTRADAHVRTHQFGLFGSLFPFGNDTLGITIGYAGVFVSYLEEFNISIQTIQPTVWKHGINFAARYRIGDLTLRTDHNFSFWDDRNYRVFNLHRPIARFDDFGLHSRDSISADVAEVRHTFLWNGIGAAYQVTPIFEFSAYARNLLRIDETEQLRMLNSYANLELRSTFRLGSSVEAFVGFVFDYTLRNVNRELNQEINNALVGTGEFPPPFEVRATTDTRMVIQIPMGLTVRLQRGIGNN